MSTPTLNGFFDFLATLDAGYNAKNIRRLNLRHQQIIEPIRDLLTGSRVLDLGAHDGRWAYAAAAAGASQVVGIEGRRELVERFADYPDRPFKRRVDLRVGDFNRVMTNLARDDSVFDVILCLGVYYHIMDHYPLLLTMRALGPKLIVMDTTLHHSKAAAIFMERETTEGSLNAIDRLGGQAWVPVGTPTTSAMMSMTESVGYRLRFLQWPDIYSQESPVKDYYRSRNRRYTFHLTPTGSMGEPSQGPT